MIEPRESGSLQFLTINLRTKALSAKPMQNSFIRLEGTPAGQNEIVPFSMQDETIAANLPALEKLWLKNQQSNNSFANLASKQWFFKASTGLTADYLLYGELRLKQMEHSSPGINDDKILPGQDNRPLIGKDHGYH